MKTDLWFNTTERLPKESGYWLAFKGMSIGDDETRVDYYFWDAEENEWRDYESKSHGSTVNVIFWCTADPLCWYKGLPTGWIRHGIKERKMTDAEINAWAAVERAVENYNMIKELSQ